MKNVYFICSRFRNEVNDWLIEWVSEWRQIETFAWLKASLSEGGVRCVKGKMSRLSVYRGRNRTSVVFRGTERIAVTYTYRMSPGTCDSRSSRALTCCAAGYTMVALGVAIARTCPALAITRNWAEVYVEHQEEQRNEVMRWKKRRKTLANSNVAATRSQNELARGKRTVWQSHAFGQRRISKRHRRMPMVVVCIRLVRSTHSTTSS